MPQEKVKCPYCGQEFNKLNTTHLKKHGKTLTDLRNEHPEIPARMLNSSWASGGGSNIKRQYDYAYKPLPY